MAEGLAQSMFPDAEIQSAGSHPSSLNPYAVKALAEVGIDISNRASKSIDHLSPRFIVGLDYVITLCAEEVCPSMVSKAKRLHWPVPDPATKETLPEVEALGRFRSARDAIHEKLKAFKQELPQ